MILDAKVEEAFVIAKKAQANAYAPYSNFQVGSAVKFQGSDKIYPGCNVENASFGGTVCAERTAILSGVADRGKKDLEFVVVVSKTTPPVPPCALCLQVIAEFANPDTPIYLATDKQITQKLSFKELLPKPFNKF